MSRYNALAELTLADFRRMARRPGWEALDRLPTQDLEGTGLARHEAENCFTAGLCTEDLHQIERRAGEELGDKRVGEHLQRLGLR